MISTTSFDGMANPIPSTALPATADVDEILLELIPITCPSILTKAPPELPGLIAASVWIAFVETVSPLSFCIVTVRLRLETIPSVTELAYSVPSGLPIAIAFSPTVREFESANSATVLILSEETLTTARSE